MKIEFQHFQGCPNGPVLLKRVKEAVDRSSYNIELVEVIVDSPEKAVESKFRGSPTVLIDDVDFEGVAQPDNPRLSCRVYSYGLPTVDEIATFIKKQHSEKASERQL